LFNNGIDLGLLSLIKSTEIHRFMSLFCKKRGVSWGCQTVIKK
jgi:hypothetical protein